MSAVLDQHLAPPSDDADPAAVAWLSGSARPPRGSGRLRHWASLVSVLWDYGRVHRAFLFKGLAYSAAAVALRLALPWPMKSVLHRWSSRSAKGESVENFLGNELWVHGLRLAGVFFLLIVGMGLVDMLQRLSFAQFSIGTVRDLRAAGFRAATRGDTDAEPVETGDLIARLVGDTARVKAGVKGFLVHVATNGALFVGVVGVMLWVEPLLGGIIALAGAFIAWITYRGTVRMYAQAAGYRAKEGKIAESIHRVSADDPADAAFAKVNAASGKQEATLTRIEGISTWLAYSVYGVAVLACFWIAVTILTGDGLSRGEMVVFLIYVLILRSPVVQLVRQGTRTGKVLASLDRLRDTLPQSQTGPLGTPVSDDPAPRFTRSLVLDGVKVNAKKSTGSRRKLGPISLIITPGCRVAVVGKAGAGKTTLLRVIAGLDRARRGQITWDDVPAPGRPLTILPEFLGILSQTPHWRRHGLRDRLGLDAGETGAAANAILDVTGVLKIIKRLDGGLDARVGSNELSPGECRQIALAKLLLARPQVLLLDGPADGLKDAAADELLSAAANGPAGRSVIVTMASPVGLAHFDRVIELKSGRVIFDGTPAQWPDRKSLRLAAPPDELPDEPPNAMEEGEI